MDGNVEELQQGESPKKHYTKVRVVCQVYNVLISLPFTTHAKVLHGRRSESDIGREYFIIPRLRKDVMGPQYAKSLDQLMAQFTEAFLKDWKEDSAPVRGTFFSYPQVRNDVEYELPEPKEWKEGEFFFEGGHGAGMGLEMEGFALLYAVDMINSSRPPVERINALPLIKAVSDVSACALDENGSMQAKENYDTLVSAVKDVGGDHTEQRKRYREYAGKRAARVAVKMLCYLLESDERRRIYL